MLNDLLAIERGLAAHGLPVEGRHSDIKDVGKGDVLRVRLKADGAIVSLEYLDKRSRQPLWTLRNGRKNAFPVLTTHRPEELKRSDRSQGRSISATPGVLSVPKSDLEEIDKDWKRNTELESRRDQLIEIATSYEIDERFLKVWPGRAHVQAIKLRREQLASLSLKPETASIPAVFDRFLLALGREPSFLEMLVDTVRDRLKTDGTQWVALARDLFFGSITLSLDVDDSDFIRDAGDPRQIGPISFALGDAHQTSTPSAQGSPTCALQGVPIRLHTGTFPEPNLPAIGPAVLFSRNKDIPSLGRYGRVGTASYPVGTDLLAQLAGAFKSLTAQHLWNKTWRRVPGERLVTQNGKKVERWDLMIASLPSAPDVPLARDLAGDDDDDDIASLEISFKELASRVTDQSRGKYEHDSPQDEVNVLIIRKIDKGNHKTVYHRKTTSADFWKAARDWQSATANTPDWLRFPFPGKAKAEVILRGPPYVTPLSITPISRVQFANGGRRPIEVIGIPASQAFQLFLKEGDVERRARDLLHLLIERHGDLLAGVAAARTKGTEFLKDFDPKADLRRNALRSATWICALLHHLGRVKEDYMSDAGFRLGQLLAAADVVHVGYCMDVRDGSIPSSLLGNSLLGMAAERPSKALSLLLKRWPPYASWAKNEPKVQAVAAKSEKSKAIALRKGLSQARRIGLIASALREQLRDADSRTDEMFQAELLLGYMAGLPPAANEDGSVSNTAEDIQSNEGENA